MGSRDSKSAMATVLCKGADAVHRMTEAARSFGIVRALKIDHAARLSIIVEELVSNLVEHGEVGEGDMIELVLTHEDGAVGIALSDTGIAFDPRTAESEKDIPERGGGAGIDLVRAWAEIVDYASDKGRNRLLLKMWLS
jgi:anti-sigma regulatory factor (Ser/Thr protein kinase)